MRHGVCHAVPPSTHAACDPPPDPVCPPPHAQGGGAPTVDELLALAGDQLAEQLDAVHGAGVTDQSIYRAHAAKYEVSTRPPGCHHSLVDAEDPPRARRPAAQRLAGGGRAGALAACADGGLAAAPSLRAIASARA